MTHHDPRSQSSCVVLNSWIQAAICRRVRDGRAEAMALLNETERSVWHRLEGIDAYGEDDIMSSGYTVHTLEAAAWSFLTTESYEEAVIRAANLGDHADTFSPTRSLTLNVIFPVFPSASTTTWSPCSTSPSRIFSASGSCTSF